MEYFGKAYISSYKKDFEAALKYLAEIRTKQFTFVLDSYTIKAKAYYELNHAGSAKSLADTFRHYLKNNHDISDHFRQGMLNFIKYYRKLFALRSERDKMKLEALNKAIKSDKNVRLRDWLLSKSV